MRSLIKMGWNFVVCRVTIEHARSRRGRGGGPGMGGGRFSPRFGGYRQSRSGGSRYYFY